MDAGGMRLELIEWRRPRVENIRRTSMAQPGIARICLRTTNADAVLARLVAAGFSAYSAPSTTTLGGSGIRLFCAEDPDGTVIEFMEFLGRSAGHAAPAA